MSSSHMSPQATLFVSLLLIGVVVIMVVALIRYDVDAALKVWAAVDPFAGIIVGAGAAYGLTRKEVIEANKRADALEALARRYNLI